MLNSITKPPANQPFKHTTDPEILGKLLLEIERLPASTAASKAFLKILPYLACRPSELPEALWEDMQDDCLVIPAERMKKRRPHLIPLPSQAIEIIDTLKIHTKHLGYLFANPTTGKPITEESSLRLLQRHSLNGTPLSEYTTLHGFRHTASTLLHNQGYPTEHIEMQLAHADKNTIRGTYNHAQYLDQRREMMQAYADYLDQLKAQALQKELSGF